MNRSMCVVRRCAAALWMIATAAISPNAMGSAFAPVATTVGFEAEFAPSEWMVLTVSDACGASSVVPDQASVTLTTAADCSANDARFTHFNANAGAPADARVELAYEITQTAAHDYEATVGVADGDVTRLTESSPQSGTLSFSVRAGQRIEFVLRKTSGTGSATFVVRDFRYIPRGEGFNGAFANGQWTPSTQSFGCGDSNVVADPATVRLSTGYNCAQIFATYAHSNGGSGAPVDGTAEFFYEVGTSQAHQYEAFVQTAENEILMLARDEPASGRIALGLRQGQQLTFVIRKLNGFGVSTLKVSGFSFTPLQRGFVETYRPSQWSRSEVLDACGNASVVAGQSQATLTVPSACTSSEASYLHPGASGSGTIRFSYLITDAGAPTYAAQVEVDNAITVPLGSNAGSGSFQWRVNAGDPIEIALRKTAGTGQVQLEILDFEFIPDVRGFIRDFRNSAWLRQTETFECGASSVQASPSQVRLETTALCSGIEAAYVHDNGGLGVPEDGTIEFDYDIDVTTDHPHEVEFGVVDGKTYTISREQGTVGRFGFTVAAGDRPSFRLRKLESTSETILTITGFRFTPRVTNFSGDFDASRWTPETPGAPCGTSTVAATATSVSLASSAFCEQTEAAYRYFNDGDGASSAGVLSLSYDLRSDDGEYEAVVSVPGRHSTIVREDQVGWGSLRFPLQAGETVDFEVVKRSGISAPTLTISGFSFEPADRNLLLDGFEDP
jgi:hypothetical protein